MTTTDLRNELTQELKKYKEALMFKLAHDIDAIQEMLNLRIDKLRDDYEEQHNTILQKINPADPKIEEKITLNEKKPKRGRPNNPRKIPTKKELQQLLTQHEWNKSQVARHYNITRITLYKWIENYKLKETPKPTNQKLHILKTTTKS